MMPALAKRMSSLSKSDKNFLAAAATDWSDDRSHSRNVTGTLGEMLRASLTTSSAFPALRPVKTMWPGLCFTRRRIVVLPIPAVPDIVRCG
jgi:hypothetical protein